MRKKSNLSLDLIFGGIAAPQETDVTDEERQRLLKAMRLAVEGELTPRQRFCIQKRIFEQDSVTHIADALGVNPSTVTRHIQRACKRLGKVLGYSFPRFNGDSH